MFRVTGHLALLSTLACFIVACGDSPASPSSPGPSVTPGVQLTCQVGSGDCSSVMEGQEVVFTAMRTGGLTVSSAVLDFGDGASVSLGALADTVAVRRVYERRGAFTARLTATDATGATRTATQAVTVGSFVSLAMDVMVSGPLQVVGTARLAGAVASRYEWIFDPQVDPVVTVGPRAEFTYATPGWKDVMLRVTLEDGRILRASGSVVAE